LIPHVSRRLAVCRALSTILLAIFAVGIMPPVWATASLDDEPEPRLRISAQARADGRTSVTEEFVWDTQASAGTFTRALPLFVPRTEASWRKFEYTNFVATSPDAQLTLTVADDAISFSRPSVFPRQTNPPVRRPHCRNTSQWSSPTS
jgi:hypothetical protein